MGRLSALRVFLCKASLCLSIFLWLSIVGTDARAARRVGLPKIGESVEVAFEGRKAGGFVWLSGTVKAERARARRKPRQEDFQVLFDKDNKKMWVGPDNRWRRPRQPPARAPPPAPALAGVGARAAEQTMAARRAQNGAARRAAKAAAVEQAEEKSAAGAGDAKEGEGEAEEAAEAGGAEGAGPKTRTPQASQRETRSCDNACGFRGTAAQCAAHERACCDGPGGVSLSLAAGDNAPGKRGPRRPRGRTLRSRS